jgi:putative transposase
MPRTARASAGDYCYHVLNRGNGRAEVFHDASDYEAFLELIAAATARLPMRVLGWCLMPNHFHLVVRPHHDGDLSRWMQWLMTSHVRRYRRRHGSSGHVWQGRFKAFPCQDDGHLLTVLRYVERNALRAGLVGRAEDWRFGSLFAGVNITGPVALDTTFQPRDAKWIARVNRPMSEKELAVIRHSIRRGTPFGTKAWASQTAEKLGLESSLRPQGRPRKQGK